MKNLIILSCLILTLVSCNSEDAQKIADDIQERVDRGMVTYKLKNIEDNGAVKDRVHFALIFDCNDEICNVEGWLMGYQTDAVPEAPRRAPVHGTLNKDGDVYSGSVFSNDGCVGDLYDVEFDRETKFVRFVNIGWTAGTFDQTTLGHMFTGSPLDQFAIDYVIGCVDLH